MLEDHGYDDMWDVCILHGAHNGKLNGSEVIVTCKDYNGGARVLSLVTGSEWSWVNMRYLQFVRHATRAEVDDARRRRGGHDA